MKTSRIPLFFIISLTLFFIAITTVAILAYRLSMRMNRLVLESNTSQVESTMGYILDQNGENLRKVVYDYTFWDDFASFVDSKEKGWGELYLDPMMKNFSLDGLWVYNFRQNTVYSKTREVVATLQTYKIPAEAFSLLDKNAFLHYYEFTSNGLLEIQAATIHPSDDEAHQNTPRGYFFICRAWNPEYLLSLGETLHSEINLFKGAVETNSTNDQISFSKVLPGIDGKPAAWVQVNKKFEKLKEYRNASNLLLGHFFLIIILILVFIFWAFYLLVKKPVSIIKKALNLEDPLLTKSLRIYGGPFVAIGRQLEQMQAKDEHQKATINEAAELDFQKVAFLKDFSHMIRTPLGGLTGFSVLLSQPGLEDEKRALYASQMRKCSIDLLKTVDEGLKEFSGTDPGFYYSLKEKPEYPITISQALEKLKARNPKLVLIEDDPASALYIRECLAFDGVQLEVFSDAPSGIEYIKKHLVSLILLDVQLPGMDGWEAATTIKHHAPAVPLVIQTAFATASDRRKAAEIGCDDYLAKPYTPDELLSIILRNLPLEGEGTGTH
jgi:CheY-like chemotaxis protein